MPATIPPCRLYFILAREAPIGIIFRRGPSKWVQLIKWRTDTDEFEAGQWFHGSVQPEHADLSPSGELLIYPAQKYKVPRYATAGVGIAWTAISKTPYFTALALWPNISVGFGGGIFDSEREVRIWYRFDDLGPHPEFDPGDHLSFKAEAFVSTYPDQRANYRLARDGWQLAQGWSGEYIESEFLKTFTKRLESGASLDAIMSWNLPPLEGSTRSGYVTYAPQIREKARPNTSIILMMQSRIDRFAATTRFSVRNNESGAALSIKGAAWADWDQAGRLVYAAEGKLFAAEIGAGAIQRRELADFNGNRSEEVEAPAWAKRW